jgi:hypothetical protein
MARLMSDKLRSGMIKVTRDLAHEVLVDIAKRAVGEDATDEAIAAELDRMIGPVAIKVTKRPVSVARGMANIVACRAKNNAKWFGIKS